MIYIEYISRRPDVDIATFHRGVAAGQTGWEREHPEDRLLWSAGRTWRMGPGPGYVGAWWTAGQGVERIDYWERVFRAGIAGGAEDPFQRVATIDAAGCYEPLLEPVVASRGTYYVEFFRMTGSTTNATALYKRRAGLHGRITLNMVAHRIGKLGPEPGGIAVWTIPNFAALADIVDEINAMADPIELVSAGTYADVGSEIL